MSLAALAFTFSSCNNSVSINTTANNTANKPNTAVNNTTPVSDTKANSAPSKTEIYTPAKDSPERIAIMDALRAPIAKELKQDIIFTVDKLKVQGDWAFFSGLPKNKEGGEPDWKITKYQQFIDSGDFEEGLFALLKKSGDKWEVVKYMMNCHDVCYLGWDKEYKAPKEIFE